jgi:2-keto-4-pentenoate hydratase/2-oxohepta-3-ene-1,7-dioic acid hydratase in catechol pathway
MATDHWCRVRHDGRPRVGRLVGHQIVLHEGDLFDPPAATADTLAVDQADWLAPVEPRQFLGLWNNFHERRQLEDTRTPDFPLFFAKLGESLSVHGQPIARPPGYDGVIKFEAELGIVIGHRCYQASPEAAADAIFGYTCVNDVTAADPLFANPEFPQWCRAKSFPGFGPIGPTIATGIDPSGLRVRGILDGQVRQDYPVSDMIFSPTEIVWHIAHELVLLPGDVIACGTSVGAGAMRAGQTIEIDIPGVGRLSNSVR